MSCSTILAGLPESKSFWVTMELIRYLLLLNGLNAVSGLYIAKVVQQCEIFTLPRSGYARWYHRSTLSGSLVLWAALGVITMTTCFVSGDNVQSVVLAAVIFGINLTLMFNLQMLITLLSGSVSVGYLVSMFVQSISLFLSERFPPAGKILLIGNWGMMVRSTLVDPAGIPIGPVIGLEFMLLVLLWKFGWRILRWNRRGASC